jgi:xanthine dehydrogenase YagS FAD-binding subunit
VEIAGPDGERRVPIEHFHRLPGDTPHIETVLRPAEIITAVLLPGGALGRASRYFKVRDRASFEWAIASAAVAIEVDAGAVRRARVAVGGVATKPWRLPRVEQTLTGQPFTPELCAKAAALATDGATAHGANAYKVPLLKATVERALLMVGGFA